MKKNIKNKGEKKQLIQNITEISENNRTLILNTELKLNNMNIKNDVQKHKIYNTLKKNKKIKKLLTKDSIKKSPNREFSELIINSQGVKEIKNIFIKSAKLEWEALKKNKQSEEKYDNLYQLLYDESVLLLSTVNIANNKGSSTHAIKKQTLDGTRLSHIKQIAKQILDEKYYFSPFKRKMIPKQKKPNHPKNEPPKMRPLGIPEWKDRIVQEALRMILNAIYEPIFFYHGGNYGFRPGKSSQDAMYYLKVKGQNLPTALEGDIKGAYDNIDFKIMIKILRKKIKDNRFINLIENSLKCGLFYENKIQETFTGVPQGSIVSPLLFNIYMHEFDTYIKNTITKEIENFRTFSKKNHNNEDNEYVNREYQDLRNQVIKLKEILKKAKERLSLHYPDKNTFFKIYRKNQKENILKIRKIKTKQKLTQYYDYNKQPKKFVYVRYADDWIILSNISTKQMQTIKEKCKNYLKDELKLELAEDKTNITNIKKTPAKFLGFIISLPEKQKVSTIYKKNKEEKKIEKIFKQRTTSGLLRIGIDSERLLTNLFIKKFITKNRLPKRKPEWSILSIPDIIINYNSIIRGIYNYYAPIISSKHYLNYYVYLLAFSCYHTIAQKYNSSITKIIKKFGNPINLKIPKHIKTKSKKNNLQSLGKIEEQSENSRSITLIYKKTQQKKLYTNIKQRREEISLNYKKHRDKQISLLSINMESKYIDPFSIKFINLRVGTVLRAKNCCICDSDQDIELHHIRKLKDKTKAKGFGIILSQISRRTIPVCHECHIKIHKGLYDGISLKNFAYNPQ